jgi:hypothetical protein
MIRNSVVAESLFLKATIIVSPSSKPIGLSIYGSTDLVDFARFFIFLVLYRVGRTPWTGNLPVARPLPTHITAPTQNKSTQTSMPRVGFETAIPVFERTKTVHALDSVATVTGTYRPTHPKRAIYLHVRDYVL